FNEYKIIYINSLFQVVREHYLRDDVWCGYDKCTVCKGNNRVLENLTEIKSNLVPFPHHLVIDSNVAIHQIDLLSQDAITNVIIPQTVMHEVKHHSLAIYKRLRDLIETSAKHFYVFTNEHHGDCYIEREEKESVNDCNDRSIRIACWWYQQHFSFYNQNVVLLTNDQSNKNKAKELELDAFTVQEYVEGLKDSGPLLDFVAQAEDSQDADSNRKFIYSPHWSLVDIRSGIKKSKLKQGVLKTSTKNYLEANVMVEGSEKSILIQGRDNINRALHDDVVAIQILPKEKWSTPSTVVLDQQKQEEEKETGDDEGDNERQAMAKEEAILASGVGDGEKQPTGRVVGVIRRKWRQYCGIIKKSDITQV
ncbi:UNVERIFIED_CONTAM: hypothetical protein GTU68_040344, partial [Idotea baltica]|nr:hypothetical protein [Idotea baltica]